jgi:hypothetical protein
MRARVRAQKTVLRIVVAALAIAGFVTVEAPGQGVPVQAALVEFGCETRTACSLRRRGHDETPE